MVSIDDPTKVTAEVLKSLKPPSIKGEDKQQNKDIVDTFLSKWAKIRVIMHGTHDQNKLCPTCLSLEVKAYKQWMAIKPHEKPNTWAIFESDFYQKFLPSKENKWSLKAWDFCKQKHCSCSLTQHVSLY